MSSYDNMLHPLPDLSEVWKEYKTYSQIPDKSLQKKVFIKSFIEVRGNIVDQHEPLGIARSTANLHFESVKDEMLRALCLVDGSFDRLAQAWGVSPEDLRAAFARANRFLKHASEILEATENNLEKAAAKLGVPKEQFEATLARLRELAPGASD